MTEKYMSGSVANNGGARELFRVWSDFLQKDLTNTSTASVDQWLIFLVQWQYSRKPHDQQIQGHTIVADWAYSI